MRPASSIEQRPVWRFSAGAGERAISKASRKGIRASYPMRTPNPIRYDRARPDQEVRQEVPDELKGKEETMGEAPARPYLRSARRDSAAAGRTAPHNRSALTKY